MHPRRVEGTSQLNLRRDSKITCGLATVTFTFAFAVTDAVVVVFAFAKQFRSGRRAFARLDPSSPPSLGASGDARRCGLGPRRRASRAPRRISEPRRAACVSHRLRPRGKLVVSPSPRKLRRNGVARLAADPSSRPRRCISRVRALRILPRPGAILLSELADSLRSTRHAEVHHVSRKRARGPSVGNAICRVDARRALRRYFLRRLPRSRRDARRGGMRGRSALRDRLEKTGERNDSKARGSRGARPASAKLRQDVGDGVCEFSTAQRARSKTGDARRSLGISTTKVALVGFHRDEKCARFVRFGRIGR